MRLTVEALLSLQVAVATPGTDSHGLLKAAKRSRWLTPFTVPTRALFPTPDDRTVVMVMVQGYWR